MLTRHLTKLPRLASDIHDAGVAHGVRSVFLAWAPETLAGLKYLCGLALGVALLGAAGQLLAGAGVRLANTVASSVSVQTDLARFHVPPTPSEPLNLPWATSEVATSAAAAPSDPERATLQRLFQSPTPLKVRAGPSEDSLVLGILRPFKSIAVIDEKGDWAKFVGPTGRGSWVNRTSLVPVVPE